MGLWKLEYDDEIEDIDLDNFFKENNTQKEEKKETIICPYCEKEFEIYRKREMELLESDFDKEIKRLRDLNK